MLSMISTNNRISCIAINPGQPVSLGLGANNNNQSLVIYPSGALSDSDNRSASQAPLTTLTADSQPYQLPIGKVLLKYSAPANASMTVNVTVNNQTMPVTIKFDSNGVPNFDTVPWQWGGWLHPSLFISDGTDGAFLTCNP